MSDTLKFTPPAEVAEEKITVSERLARVKSVRGRANPESLKNRLARSEEKKVRAVEAKTAAEQRKAEREEKAAHVRAERRAFAEARAEERVRVAKESKADDFVPDEVSDEKPKDDDYESYEVSEGEDLEKTKKDEKFKEVMTDLKGRLKRREKEREEETDKHDEIEEAAKRYFEVGGDELKQFLFDESWTKTRLTRKELESKPKELKFLKKWFFGEDNHRQTLEDFLAALPTEQDYVDNMVDKIGKSRSGSSGKIAKEVEEDSTLIKKTKKSDVGELEATPKVEEVISTPEGVSPAKFADLKPGQSISVRRSNGKIDGGWRVLRRLEENKEVEVIKMEGGNSLKKVVTVKEIFVPTEVRNQNEELPAISGEIDTEVIDKKLLIKKAKEEAAKKVPFISPDNIEESRRLAEEDDAAFKKSVAKFAPKTPKTEEEFWATEAKPSTLETARARVAAMPEANRKRAEAAPLAKKLSGMSTKEGVEHVSKEVKAGKQKLLDEIAARYLKKFDSKENAHKFLMGPEVKGWFKGGQRRDQENYKKLYNELK